MESFVLKYSVTSYLNINHVSYEVELHVGYRKKPFEI